MHQSHSRAGPGPRNSCPAQNRLCILLFICCFRGVGKLLCGFALFLHFCLTGFLFVFSFSFWKEKREKEYQLVDGVVGKIWEELKKWKR